MNRLFRLATRTSPLALWQAREAARRLRAAHPGLEVRLVGVVAGADLDLATPLYAMGVVGVFCKEVQALVLAGRAEAGVHSCKDLPTGEPAGLALAAILPRADARDLLIGARSLAALPPGALLGTSSTRRRAQLAALRPDLRFTDLRGNVHTRLGKIARGEAQATCMAVAGLRRLGLSAAHAAAVFDPWHELTPAPGQGAVAIDCRADDARARHLLAALHHRRTAIAVGIERAVLAGLAGGCSLPLGAHAALEPDGWQLTCRLGRSDGSLVCWHGRGPAAGLAGQALNALR